MRITERIAGTLLQLLEEQGGAIQIQRNDLAERLGCVPSQINYVITSRFTKEQGYIVESRRGGGGFVRIVRVDCTGSSLTMHVINSIGDSVDEMSARMLIQGIHMEGQLSAEQARLMTAVCADENLRGLPDGVKQCIRARLMKTMLIHTL